MIEIEAAALVAMAGMNPMRFIFERDGFARAVMQKIAQRRIEIAADERQDLAERIINVLGKAMGK